MDRRKALFAAISVLAALSTYALLQRCAEIALWPHVSILRFLFGMDFQYVGETGYVSPSGVIITPSCMGAKLFVCAFLMLSIRFRAGFPVQILYYFGSALGALIVSMLRIVWSMPFVSWPNGQLIHNGISLLVYFSALIGLYVVADSIQRRERCGTIDE